MRLALKSLIKRGLPRVIVNFGSILRPRFLRTRWKVFASFNALFFGGVFVTLLLAGTFLPPPLYTGWNPDLPELFMSGGWLFLMLGIFIFNLALSSFVFVTLPGIVFFPLSPGFLLYRALLLGLFLYAQPVWLFVISLPVILFEGEAYVLAAVAGTVFGASWVHPNWTYPGEKWTRVEVLKKATKEFAGMYILISIFLFIAAVTETIIVSAIV